MVDCVKLVLVDQPLEMRKLECNYPVRRKQMRHACGEVVEIGDLRQNIIANNKIGPPPLGLQALSEFQAKKFDQCRNIFLTRNFGDISGWLDAGNRDTKWQKMLKQISIVACNFKNPTICAETEPIY